MTPDGLIGSSDHLVGVVLVVDDHAGNRLLLRDLLESRGHTVLEADNGLTALERVQTSAPDVVLLDVHMPRMDGFEVCRRLKSTIETAYIPVLLVTALNAREHRLEGMRAGANDFITKPIDTADLVLRVRNAIQMRQLFAEIEAQYRQLRDLEQLRDNLVHMVVHDLRSPLTAVQSALEYLQLNPGGLDGDGIDSVELGLESTRRVIDLVGDVLDVSRIEAGRMPLKLETIDLARLALEASRMVQGRGVPIICPSPSTPIEIRGDQKILGRVLVNLIDNAVKFSARGAPVTIAVSTADGGATVAVRDSGPGIAREAQSRIFEKFGQVSGTEQSHRSSGLGLTFCRLAVEAHGGTIGLESELGHGSTFWFAIPIADPADPARAGSLLHGLS
jgi:signal transduction histidine kinase